MKILAIETSCDETAIAILDAEDSLKDARFSVFSNIVLSQVNIHAEYGGVYPALAKREHAKNLIPVLKQAFEESGTSKRGVKNFLPATSHQLQALLEREPELLEQFIKFIPTIEKPTIDAIAVTYGPGLEPALWVGINFAKALSMVWDIPIIPVNHMEGHLVSALLKRAQIDADKMQIHADEPQKKAENLQSIIYDLQPFQFPILALLISGGHTELVLSKKWFEYEIVGQTKDDAVGESFDKVARMLGLPYPGGPQISALAEIADRRRLNADSADTHLRKSAHHPRKSALVLPRPMIHSGDFNFSFSGLKTAVLYTIKKIPGMTDAIRAEIAHEFQEAVAEVLVSKTIAAAEHYGIKTILVGGGVSANSRINELLDEAVRDKLEATNLYIAPRELTGDNALMIGVAGYLRHSVQKSTIPISEIKAEGNVRLR